MIKLRAHFGVNESYDPNAEENIFKTTDKTWEPKETHHTVSTFIDAINNEIQQEQMNNRKTLPKPNLSQK